VASTSAAYALTTTAGAGSAVPYLPPSFVASGNYTVSPILGYRAGGLSNGLPVTTSRVLQAGISVVGNGPQQTSGIFVMTGDVFNDAVYGWTQTGAFQATTLLGTLQGASHASGTVSSLPSSITIDSNGLPTGSFGTNQNRFDGAPLSVYTPETAFTNAGGQQNYTFTQTSTRTTTPPGLGSDHPNALMTAYAGGILQTVTFNPSTALTGSSSAPISISGVGSVFLQGNASRMGATFNVAAVPPVASGALAAAVVASPPPPQFQSATFQFGSASPSDLTNTQGLNSSHSAYIDRTNFGARGATLYSNGVNVEISSVTDTNGMAFANSAGNTATSLSQTALLLVTANTVGANSAKFLSSISSTSVTPCTCEYTQWGFWSVDTFRTDQGRNIGYSDRGNLLTWVAGIPANAADIPTTGVATYSGHAVANISNNGSQYIAAGTFSNNVNFATRTGQVQVGGLDATNYSGTVNLQTGSAAFGGSLSSGASARNMSMSGQFFQGGPTNTTPLYGEMGGTISISGPNNYIGSGIFAGRKP